MRRVRRKTGRLAGSLDTCPTCGNKRDDGGYEPSTYRFMGEDHRCYCLEQVMLRKLYIHADIPEQYMRLNWDRDYQGPNEDVVPMYLDKWQSMRGNGMGIEFGGTQLGVGKTFAATTIGKELIKRRVPVVYAPFMEVKNLLSDYTNTEEIDRIRDTEVLILDEVISPPTDRSAAVFASHFEAIIRHRTNWNLPTIMTTNMSEEDLEATYARVYSLLAAKQIRVEMTGEDARQGLMQQENLELVMNDEIRPIS